MLTEHWQSELWFHHSIGGFLVHLLLLMFHPATISHPSAPSPTRVPDTKERPLTFVHVQSSLATLGVFPVCFWWLLSAQCFKGRVNFRNQVFWGGSAQGKGETRDSVDPQASENFPQLLPSILDSVKEKCYVGQSIYTAQVVWELNHWKTHSPVGKDGMDP